ncbi:caspase family protein [Ruegeria sp. 2205SS24-7]|uniref:caspase family protein n=1 Tax=Ruegeria discodermiae TaxID=3064389 RepID=UPI002741F6C4|nr:caspase family protein [Ruegeria sp. 2205SS24-7]MDP5219958.1 caspase family protein [Ruegeria sp. 2205SS24-7]
MNLSKRDCLRLMASLAATGAFGVGLSGAARAQGARGLRLAGGGQRVAIVIGNQDYENVVDLGNAAKDARDMAAMLREFRFKVFDGYDLKKRDFEQLLRTAVLNIPQGADVVFYYAGHGIQIGRRNYLLPVDAKFENVYDLPLETMTLDRVIDTLAARGSAHVAILDSCRDNPFQNLRLAADLDANLFETGAGFEVFRTPLNSLVAYSTSPGELAMDGAEGGNSPYTAAVLKAARSAPTENILQLFPLIREQVHTATGGVQVPWESSTLVRPFHLAQAQIEAPVADTGTAPVVSLNLNETFNRLIPLDDAIRAELGQEITSAALLAPPANGLVSLNDEETGGIVGYAPEITDMRALDVTETSKNDAFSLEVAPASGPPVRIDVALTLTYDPCDLAAGDALDLNGVGIYRLPNDLDLIEGLATCEASVRANPNNARYRYQLARLQQSAKQLEEAHENFQAAADAGHIRAKHGLSVLLNSEQIDRDVVKIPYDPDKARALLEEAIAEQDPYAMHTLGKRLMRNGATEAERQRGFELLERSVELGHTFSMNELGYYFLTKDTDHYIPERGMRYLTASQLRDDIYGYDNLGFVSLYGLDGSPTDPAKALEWFTAASDGGHPTAPSNIARMILNDQVPGKTGNDALGWYDIALARGDAWGGANGAIIILNGRAQGVSAAEAGIRAAKASLLANEEPAALARENLGTLSRSDIDRALQTLLNQLGEPVGVDGQAGPATQAALERVSAANGVPVPFAATQDPTERLLLAAKVYWAQNPVRFDLF